MNHFSFKGMYTRKQFWLTQLVCWIVIAVGFGLMVSAPQGDAGPLVIGLILIAAQVIPNWASLAKRVRDTGNNAWLCLLAAIPYVGIVPFLYFGFTSKSVTNGTIGDE